MRFFCLFFFFLSLGLIAESARDVLLATGKTDGKKLLGTLANRFPRECDWLLQDGFDFKHWLTADKAKVGRELARKAEVAVPPDADPAVSLAAYFDSRRSRHRTRLQTLAARCPQLVFVKRHPVTPSFFAYTEGQSDAQNERHFRPDSSLCRLRITADGDVSQETLLHSPQGVIRDVEVSYDGKRLLFAWKKGNKDDDYHLYEMGLGELPRQLTFGLGFADFEPAYLPNDDIVFSSTRCVQTVDCWWTEVSNLYTCDRQGRYLRRLGFDQVHTVSPSVLDDGSVVYTRWDYNDRGQVFPQALFRMNPDGTGQTELYGNNSYFPTTTAHARGIPGTNRLVAVAMGHHTWQAGKLIEIDPSKGRQEATGIEMLCPRRPAKAVRVDRYGQQGDLFRHPYPLNGQEYLVAFVPAALNRGRGSRFSLYWMHADGRRELLVDGGGISCNSPIPLKPRPRPHSRPSLVDYRKKSGSYYLQDIYRGPGLRGISRGTIKKLRVVALEFRAAGVDHNNNRGPAGGALVSTPIAVKNGSWDVKRVLGEARVESDGSAFFTCPARTPVYFQALDVNGYAVQTMRSWSTLQPGENFACVGCHEEKNETPPTRHKLSLALERGPEALAPFYGAPRGFSFIREIQPILDRHCVACHGKRKEGEKTTRLTVSHCFKGDSVEAITDGVVPKHSDDHSIRRHTFWPHKGTQEWVLLNFPEPRPIGFCEIYWFDDRPRNGGCRVPESWKLRYQTEMGASWHDLPETLVYGVERNCWNRVAFPPKKMISLRVEVQQQKGRGGGILELRVGEKGADPEIFRKPLQLTGERKAGKGGRAWSSAYLNLTNRGNGSPMVNWISAQSIPGMLPPYHKGAATSELLAMLGKGHKKVKLSQEELDKLACWIDLLVPYCGDYTEANTWKESDKEKYARFQAKREKMEEEERKNIEALLRDRGAR